MSPMCERPPAPRSPNRRKMTYNPTAPMAMMTVPAAAVINSAR